MYVCCHLEACARSLFTAHVHKRRPDERTIQKLASQPTPPPEKKVSSKVTKAQRRAQQAEFNRQLWAEAYVPDPAIHSTPPDALG